MSRQRRKGGGAKYDEWKRVQLDRLASMGLARYNDYLHTDHWKAFKRKYYETHPRKCRACGHAGEKIVLHHLTYERLGCERESDVVPLCDPCHQKAHNLVNKGLAFLDVAHTLARCGGHAKGKRRRKPDRPSHDRAAQERHKQRQSETKRKAKAWNHAKRVDRKIKEAEEARKKRLGVLWTASA